MSTSPKSLNIAVVGSGAAGITAARLLQTQNRVTLYEKSDVLGGHAQSVTVDNGTEPAFDVDTAFVIFNSRSYPMFMRLLSEFGLQDRVRPTEMSFSYVDPAKDLSYAVNRGLGGLFASGKNILNPFIYSLFPELLRFRRNAARDLAARSDLHRVSLADYLAEQRHSRSFVENFLVPTAMAVWSVPAGRIRDFPAISFLRFLDNHHYLGGSRGRWLTLSGGSQQYVRAIQTTFKGQVLLRTAVASITRSSAGAEIRTADGQIERYDKVVLATHADQALALLADPSPEERRLLGAWKYQRTPTVLHTDASMMPPDRRLWASWNIQGDRVTYHLNRVQGLGSRRDYFVTLGGDAVAPEKILARFDYEHPVYDFRSVAVQSELPALNGKAHSYFCGSYFGFGFHEDAIRSGAQVAGLLGS